MAGCTLEGDWRWMHAIEDGVKNSLVRAHAIVDQVRASSRQLSPEHVRECMGLLDAELTSAARVLELESSRFALMRAVYNPAHNVGTTSLELARALPSLGGASSALSSMPAFRIEIDPMPLLVLVQTAERARDVRVAATLSYDDSLLCITATSSAASGESPWPEVEQRLLRACATALGAEFAWLRPPAAEQTDSQTASLLPSSSAPSELHDASAESEVPALSDDSLGFALTLSIASPSASESASASASASESAAANATDQSHVPASVSASTSFSSDDPDALSAWRALRSARSRATASASDDEGNDFSAGNDSSAANDSSADTSLRSQRLAKGGAAAIAAGLGGSHSEHAMGTHPSATSSRAGTTLSTRRNSEVEPPHGGAHAPAAAAMSDNLCATLFSCGCAPTTADALKRGACCAERHLDARELEAFRLPANATVLIVDDSRLTRAVIRSRVKTSFCAEGIEPRLFPPAEMRDGAESEAMLRGYQAALEFLVRLGPVVLFSDENLGNGIPKGSEVISAVRESVPEAEANLVAIIVSANSATGDQAHFALAGADAFASKERDGLVKARRDIERACARRFGRQAWAAPPAASMRGPRVSAPFSLVDTASSPLLPRAWPGLSTHSSPVLPRAHLGSAAAAAATAAANALMLAAPIKLGLSLDQRLAEEAGYASAPAASASQCASARASVGCGQRPSLCAAQARARRAHAGSSTALGLPCGSGSSSAGAKCVGGSRCTCAGPLPASMPPPLNARRVSSLEDSDDSGDEESGHSMGATSSADSSAHSSAHSSANSSANSTCRAARRELSSSSSSSGEQSDGSERSSVSTRCRSFPSPKTLQRTLAALSELSPEGKHLLLERGRRSLASPGHGISSPRVSADSSRHRTPTQPERAGEETKGQLSELLTSGAARFLDLHLCERRFELMRQRVGERCPQAAAEPTRAEAPSAADAREPGCRDGANEGAHACAEFEVDRAAITRAYLAAFAGTVDSPDRERPRHLSPALPPLVEVESRACSRPRSACVSPIHRPQANAPADDLATLT